MNLDVQRQGMVFMNSAQIQVSPSRHSLAGRIGAKLRRESGSAMVEMALSCSILFVVIFGLIQFGMAFYAYDVVQQAAREATRYAAIRGTHSCDYATSTFPNCNLGPDSGGTSDANTALQAYLISRSYPLSGNMQVTANWWSPVNTTDASGNPTQTWTLSCNTTLDGNTTSPLAGDNCNFPGHAVQVQVTLAYPLTIPFWSSRTLNLSSTSQMVISE
jgi:Flp pilus assembly protein TadG